MSIQQQPEKQSVAYGSEEEANDDDDDEEEESGSNPFGFGGQQFVMIRAGNGQAYRVPISLLRQILGNEDGEEEKDEASDTEQQEEAKAAEESKEAEEAKEESQPAQKDGEDEAIDSDDWDLDDMPALEPKDTEVKEQSEIEVIADEEEDVEEQEDQLIANNGQPEEPNQSPSINFYPQAVPEAINASSSDEDAQMEQ